MQQQIAEIAGIQRLQAVLVGDVEFAALAVGKGTSVTFRDLGGIEALVLPAVDHLGELLGRPALVVETLGLDDLLDQAHDIIGIENGEVGGEADEFGMPAQKLHADGVEGAEPGHAFDRTADQMADTLLHLARGLVGEGHRENLARKGLSRCQDVGNTGGENAGLAGAGACENEDRTIDGFDGFALFRVQAGEVIGRASLVTGGHGAGGNAQSSGGRRASRGGRRSSRLARRGLFVEEGNVVETVTHAAQCSDSGRKGQ